MQTSTRRRATIAALTAGLVAAPGLAYADTPTGWTVTDTTAPAPAETWTVIDHSDVRLEPQRHATTSRSTRTHRATSFHRTTGSRWSSHRTNRWQALRTCQRVGLDGLWPVRSGDTLTLVDRCVAASAADLRRWNDLDDLGTLRAGQVLAVTRRAADRLADQQAHRHGGSW